MNELPEVIWDPAQSPFASIITTNVAPSSEELAHLKTYLVQPRTRLSEIESEIQRVKMTLSELESERDRVKAFVDAHETVASPILRLAVETLVDIFIACLPANSYPVRSAGEAPLLLTRICRDWRQIAIETPQLWTSLHLYIPSLEAECFPSRLEGMALWLRRSGTLPMSVSLYVDAPYFTANSEIAENRAISALQSVMQCHDRLKDLALAFPQARLFALKSLLPDSFPLLDSVHLRTTLFSSVDLPMDLFSPLLERAPALQKLSLGDLDASTADYFALRTGWGNLTELSLNSVGTSSTLSVPSILLILRETPLLETCALEFNLDVNFPGASLPSVAPLNYLQSLSVALQDRDDGADATIVSILFTNIACPALKSLSCAWDGPMITECPFVTLPLPNLDVLKLKMIMTSETLSQCLSLVPNITFLEITDYGPKRLDFDADFILKDHHLSRLTQSEHNPEPFCPKLRAIRIIVESWGSLSGISITGAALSGFLEKRMGTLRACDVRLPSRDLFTQSELRRLRTLKDEGLKLHIWHERPSPFAQADEPSSGMALLLHGDGAVEREDKVDNTLL